MTGLTAAIRYPGSLILLLAGLLLCPAAIAEAPPTSQPADPRELVMRVSNELVEALREQREAIQQDEAIAHRLADRIVVPYIDFERISRWVLGKHWRRASEEQRAAFIEGFRQHLMRTYVSSMTAYTDEILAHADQVDYPPLRNPDDSDQVTVRSRISLPKGGTAQVDYTMVRTDSEWKIADLAIDGISLALTYRKEFSAQIARGGLDALIARLKE
ncbi:MlaC/ttg2D family ABC transporter substrate-binding protein [Thiohalobacter thiocyanaticus]|uniref:ABC transporter substrate-binding protein n=1 Tax=Thiohalobacter thiocyanaticus TaxID=585455 RepID=A0A426QG19_9GAMM|nr:ABC transporter substrate-binding protein [Thiohalobacter thiocyanaticus]RRQ20687.1 ABC transporter substrate-binding protein [Thiohalobacter thiocyanaticus]